MKQGIWVMCALGVLVAGCASGPGPSATRTVTATTTVTVTATPTLHLEPGVVLPTPVVPDELGASALEGTRSTPSARRIRLTVFRDGCGVIRSDTSPEEFDNLTWTFRDPDGFEVLGRNAEGETRYRYFRPGTYTVAVEAWVHDGYAPVSNTVTVHC